MVIDKNLSVIILIGGRGSRFSKINEPPKQLIILNKRRYTRPRILNIKTEQNKPSFLDLIIVGL